MPFVGQRTLFRAALPSEVVAPSEREPHYYEYRLMFVRLCMPDKAVSCIPRRTTVAQYFLRPSN